MTVINACGHFLHADPNNTIPTPGMHYLWPHPHDSQPINNFTFN